MDRKFKVFQKGFNKVFDLIETADVLAIDDYEKLVGNLPVDVLMNMLTCEDFNIDNEKYNADMVRLVNAVSLEYIKYKNYLKTDIYVHRLFQEDLYKEEVNIKLFAYSKRNTVKKKEPLKVFFNHENGKYKLEKVENDDKNIIDTSCEVFLERIDDDFYLRTHRIVRGWEIYEKIIPVSFDEILQCVEDEDEYEEDIEIEFDADFDL